MKAITLEKLDIIPLPKNTTLGRLYLNRNNQLRLKIRNGTSWVDVDPFTVNVVFRIPNSNAIPSASNSGLLRYRETSNGSYVDMVMKTGPNTYERVNIVQNVW